MKSITEYHIEQYVRFPEELSKQELNEIELFISQNNEAQELADFYKEFYEELDVLHRPTFFNLQNKNLKSSYVGPMILAAMTNIKKESGLITKATFGSKEESTLIRVLEDTKHNQYQFHVLSKYLRNDDRALIGFGNTGIELITDKGGKLKNIQGHTLSDINWKDALLLLRLPTSICSYFPSGEPQEFTVCEECMLSVKDKICDFTANNPNITRVLVEQNDNIRLYFYSENTLSISVDENEPFILYLYE